MKQITITINLDPIMDGIKGDIEKSQGTAGTFFVLGTNYEHRAISEKEFYGFIDQMKEYVKQIVIGDYLLIYDDRNALAIADDKYLVGSVLLAKMGERGEVFCRMSEDDMEGAKENLAGYFAEILVNGERFEALIVE